MATKKNEAVLTEEAPVLTEEAPVLTEEAPVLTEEVEEKRVKFRLPKTRADQGDMFVRVNHETYIIKRGEEVELPESVVEVIRHAEDAELENLEFIEANHKE